MRFQIAVSMPIANAHGGRCHAWKPYFNRVTQRGCFWPHCLGSREELLSLYKFVMSLFVYWWCVMTGLGLGASLVCSPLRTEYHQQKTWVVQNKFPDCRNHVTGLAFDFIFFLLSHQYVQFPNLKVADPEEMKHLNDPKIPKFRRSRSQRSPVASRSCTCVTCCARPPRQGISGIVDSVVGGTLWLWLT